jgi:alanyl-tRNA synthetase
MKSSEIRQIFLDFFARHGHQIVSSSPLVPANDPTLLFTNAGMVQFKDTFLGLEQRPYTRAATAQKCMRVSGKHNDLENVGPSPRHHTFFEMLGNFSFGDYFKREAIQFAWDLLTKELKLPVERLWFTVFGGNDEVPPDEEAERLWIEVGAPPERVLRFGGPIEKSENFWMMGDTGPCGPCSEIHYYQGGDVNSQVAEGINSDDDNYMEIWNLVFMQYERDSLGNLTPLPRPSIDTGMGFERIVSVLQGVRSNYETDLFVPIIERLIELVGKGRDHYVQHRVAYQAIADHARACAFLIADGVRPGNEGRNYVLRRILRRAAYQGRTIGLTEPFLAEAADVVIDSMGDAYPELKTKAVYIKQLITREEERFGRTLQAGLEQLEVIVARMQAEGQTIMPGEDAFRLHDTYGFPLDLTAKILHERGLGVDEGGYLKAREEQRRRGREATQFRRGSQAEFWSSLDLPQTEFTGYHELQSFGHVLAMAIDGEQVEQATEGENVQIVLDRTCFYGESGGQVGDTGLILGPQGTVRVTDVQKPVLGLYVHFGKIERGVIAAGDVVELYVDAERRRDIMRNHTATHLLHRALRDVLGEHAEQAGSLVAPDRLRFDFSHPVAVTPEELREVERRVNAWIRANTEVVPAEMPIGEARQLGAIALFGEKYGDMVRVVTVGCEDAPVTVLETEAQAHPEPVPTFCSRELCGGTHVARTGEIAFFRIVSESSIGSGLRRIEAVTGRGAEAYVDGLVETLREAARRLGTTPAQLPERIDQLLSQLKQQQQQIAQLERAEGSTHLQSLLDARQQQNGVTFVAARVEAPNAEKLREMGDWLRDKLGSGVVVLGTVLNDKPQMVAMVTPDLVQQGYHAGKLVKALAQIVGGGGGGRPDVAQAGGRDTSKLDAALAEVRALLNQ